MKKIYLMPLLLVILLFVNVSSAYVLNCPGTIYYSADQLITFSDCVNSSYIEVGDSYFILSDMNFTITGLSSHNISYNLSFFNDTFDNHTSSYRFLEFNASYNYTGGDYFILDMPGDYYIIDMYVNGVISRHLIEEIGGVYTFQHNFTGIWEMYTFYIVGYRPECPSGASSVYNTTYNNVNLSWSNTSRADSFVLVQNNNSYPTSVTDGTVVQNNTWTYYNASAPSTAFYSLWAWNNTGYYSLDSCKLDFSWGAVIIYGVYNESNPSMIISPFGIQISNESGTEVYWNSTATAPLLISKSNIPFGTNTIVSINASGYKNTRYYYDYEINHLYNHTFYLPPEVSVVDPGTGDSEDSDSHLVTRSYGFKVIDEYTYPIPYVSANVMFFNNLTETWENRSIVLTDGYGEAEVDLIPGKNYKIFLTKENYEQIGSVDWQPESYSIYDVPETKIFKMKRVDTGIVIQTFNDLISFSGTMNSNGSIYVNYVDSSGETINAKFETFEAYNTSYTHKATNITTSSIYKFWVTGLNASRVHKITIHLNHTTLGWVNVTITVDPLLEVKYDTKNIENTAALVFGDFTLGYVNFFLIFIPAIVLLIIFGPRHAGLGIIGAGLYMGFSSLFIEVPNSILILIPLIVAIGFILNIVKGGGIKL